MALARPRRASPAATRGVGRSRRARRPSGGSRPARMALRASPASPRVPLTQTRSPGPAPLAADRLALGDEAMDLDADGQGSAGGVATHQRDPVLPGQGIQAAAEGGNPTGSCAGQGRGQGQGQGGPGRLGAHGGQIAQGHGQGLVAQGLGIRPRGGSGPQPPGCRCSPPARSRRVPAAGRSRPPPPGSRRRATDRGGRSGYGSGRTRTRGSNLWVGGGRPVGRTSVRPRHRCRA